jgi:hypothetical protein
MAFDKTLTGIIFIRLTPLNPFGSDQLYFVGLFDASITE